MNHSEIVFLTGGSPLYAVIANALFDKFGKLTIIREADEPKGMFFRRRLKRLGVFTVAGQFAFALFSRLILLRSHGIRETIIRDAGAKLGYPKECELIDVESVNSDECKDTLKKIDPKVVIVVGTRMIHKRILQCIDAPFINYHPGLTPKYRGLHGGYWTLANRDEDNLAITVHLIDENVDTGDPLYQAKISMPPGNNILTYAYAMAVEARPVVIKATEDALKSNLKPFKTDGPSKQWFHPTMWGYLWTGITRGVW